MKNSFRFLSLVLIFVYFLAGGINSKPSESFGSWHSSTAQNQGYITDLSTKLFYPQKSENISVNLANFPVQDYKNKTGSFGEIIEETLHHFKSQILQYINYRKTFLIQFRKSDLIFPFHYFW